MPPVVWYGSSIQQGGVAARAGTAYDAIISRGLSREVINLGFADNGRMELGVATVIAQMDAAVIVIDCVPDMNASEVASRTAPLVSYLRAHGHPSTPIVLAEASPTPGSWLASSVSGDWSTPANAALRTAYNALVAAGDRQLMYVSADKLFQFAPNPLVNPTVCGEHPADLGQYEMAEYYVPLLRGIINGDRHPMDTQ